MGGIAGHVCAEGHTAGRIDTLPGVGGGLRAVEDANYQIIHCAAAILAIATVDEVSPVDAVADPSLVSAEPDQRPGQSSLTARGIQDERRLPLVSVLRTATRSARP